jgi:hypothetical protein
MLSTETKFAAKKLFGVSDKKSEKNRKTCLVEVPPKKKRKKE